MKNLLLLLLFSFVCNAFGQDLHTPSSTPLKVGDTFPAYRFKNLNSGKSTLTLNDFKGKLVILDYWATWCSYCIASLPKIQQLQEKYNDQVQFILVNHNESQTLVQRFIDKRKHLSNAKIQLPVTYGDSLLTNVLLKADHLPMYYWIDGAGKIIAGTSSVEMTDKNIEKALGNKDLISENRSGVPGLFKEVDRALNMDFENKESNVLWKSSLGITDRKNDNPRIIKGNNFSAIVSLGGSIIDLYRFAYGEVINMANENNSYINSVSLMRTVLESRSHFNIGMNINNFNDPESFYIYQLVAPDNSSVQRMQDVMRSELQNWFNLQAGWEKRTIRFLSLTAKDTSILPWDGKKRDWYLNDTKFEIEGFTLDDLIGRIDANRIADFHFLPDYPIINESGIKRKIGNFLIDNVDMKDYHAIDKALQRYNMRLQLKEKEMMVFVVRDVDIQN